MGIPALCQRGPLRVFEFVDEKDDPATNFIYESKYMVEDEGLIEEETPHSAETIEKMRQAEEEEAHPTLSTEDEMVELRKQMAEAKAQISQLETKVDASVRQVEENSMGELAKIQQLLSGATR